MDAFNSVMERAYDDTVRSKMMASYKSGQETSADFINQAKNSLKEARDLANKGDTKAAKKKYEETLNLINKAGKSVYRTLLDLNSSGDNKSRTIKILFITIAAMIAMLSGCIIGERANHGTFVGFGKQMVISGASTVGGLVAQNIGFKWVDKDHKSNYKAFVKEIGENPKKVLTEISKANKDLYKQVEKEMKSL